MNRKTSESKAVLLLCLFTFVFAFAATLVPPCIATSAVKVQLCMVIDGSGTISSAEWATIVNSIAKGVNETVPHDGSVELTIVQFGARARTELSPTIIDATNYFNNLRSLSAVSTEKNAVQRDSDSATDSGNLFNSGRITCIPQIQNKEKS